MKRYMNAALVVGATVAVASSLLHAQGRGGIEWTTGSYDAHFSLKNMLKDARYAQELAKEKSLATPVLDATVCSSRTSDSPKACSRLWSSR